MPQQENGFDCGLFVCRYIFGLVQLHKNKQQNINLSTIEDSHLFKFTQKDISRMRKEFAILLSRVAIYSSQLDQELRVYAQLKAENKAEYEAEDNAEDDDDDNADNNYDGLMD